MYRAKILLAGLAAASLLLGVAAAALGHDSQDRGGMHYGYGMGQDMMMSPGIDNGYGMGPGMHRGHGTGHGMMMSPGMHRGHATGHGMMMSPGMHRGYGMGQGRMMGPGMHHGHGMHHGTMMTPDAGSGMGIGPRMFYGWPAGDARELSVEDARGWLDHKLAWHGNPRLKLGEVTEAEDGVIVAEIVTIDGSLVQKLAIDRISGFMRQLDE